MTVPSRLGLYRQLFVSACLAVLIVPGFAQDRPILPDEEKFSRQSDDFSFRYCVDPRDPGWEFDRAIGQAIAESLLLEPQEHVVTDTNERPEFDDIYRHLLADCAVYFGFKLIAGGYPEWVTVTRPYYQTGYVFVAKAPAPASLADIPAGTPVGATLASAADFRFVQYNNALPEAQRWKRYPMSNDALAIDAVLNGTVAAALVWAPSFYELTKTRPEVAALETIASPAPLTIPPMPVGAILLSRDTFLRNNVDQAIQALVQDGIITDLLAAQHMPGTAPQQ